MHRASRSARAGLTNGLSFVFDAVNSAVTDDAGWRTTYGKGVPGDVQLVNIPWSLTGALQNTLAKTDGLSLNRIEDGIWDPRHRNDFYFVTTEGGQKDGTGLDARDGGGFWRLRFKDIDKPFDGATLTLLLDGSESLGGTEPKFNKPDNIGIDRHGNVLIQEDPGGNNHLARIIAYRIKDGALGVVARFDAARFGPAASGSPAFLTIDEESSGIADGEADLREGDLPLRRAGPHGRPACRPARARDGPGVRRARAAPAAQGQGLGRGLRRLTIARAPTSRGPGASRPALVAVRHASPRSLKSDRRGHRASARIRS